MLHILKGKTFLFIEFLPNHISDIIKRLHCCTKTKIQSKTKLYRTMPAVNDIIDSKTSFHRICVVYTITCSLYSSMYEYYVTNSI